MRAVLIIAGVLSSSSALALDRAVELESHRVPEGYANWQKFALETSCSLEDSDLHNCFNEVFEDLRGIDDPTGWSLGLALFGSFGRVDISAQTQPANTFNSRDASMSLSVACKDTSPAVSIDVYSKMFDGEKGWNVSKSSDFKFAVDGGDIESGEYTVQPDFNDDETVGWTSVLLFEGDDAKNFLLSAEGGERLEVQLSLEKGFMEASYNIANLHRINDIIGTACRWW